MESSTSLKPPAKVLLILLIVAGTSGGCGALGMASWMVMESPDLAGGGLVTAWAMNVTSWIFQLAMIYVAYKLIRWVLKGSLPAPGQVRGQFERVALVIGGIGWWFTVIVCLWGLITFTPYLPDYGIEWLAAVPVVGVVFSAGVGWIVFKVLRATPRR